jgi:periplasmic protein TonB
VNVIASGDEARVTTSADHAARPAAEGQSDPSPEQTEALQELAPAPLPSEPAPKAQTPPLVEQEPTPPPAPEPPTSPETPPVSAAPPEAAPPPSLVAPPLAAPPPVVATQDPALQTLPPPQLLSVEAQLQPPPPPPPAPNQVRTQPQPRAKTQARLEPAERAKPHKPPEAKSSASSAEASLSKPGSAEAHRVGEANGRAIDVGRSRADYAALVIAQIEAHRFYPEAVRSRGEQGAVGVSFSIGPSGRVGSAAVVRSSGFADLDSAAREILGSISPPPPPGGSFSASTTIRFHFE